MARKRIKQGKVAVVPADHRARHDGWTEARRITFLGALRQTGCVRDACRIVGLSSTGAYRARAKCEAFAKAWDEALAEANKGLVAVAYQRAVVGVDVPVVRGGTVVATTRKPSDSLLALLIKRGDLREEKEVEDAYDAEKAEEEHQALIEEIEGRLALLRRHMVSTENWHACAECGGAVREDGTPVTSGNDPMEGWDACLPEGY